MRRSTGPASVLNTALPVSAVSARIRSFDTVVLPQPLSPTSPRHSPRRISKLTLSTALTVAVTPAPNQPSLRVEKDFDRFSTASSTELTLCLASRLRGPNSMLADTEMSRSDASRWPGFMLKCGTAAISALR